MNLSYYVCVLMVGHWFGAVVLLETRFRVGALEWWLVTGSYFSAEAVVCFHLRWRVVFHGRFPIWLATCSWFSLSYSSFAVMG